MSICYIHNASATIDYKQTGAKIDPPGDRRVLVIDKYAYVCYNMLNMTAFQPDPDKLTAFEELGGMRPSMTDDELKALGEIGVAIVNPRVAARTDASRYYQTEFGLSGPINDMAPEDKAALKQLTEDLRAKRLPTMVNDPTRVIDKQLTPEEKAAQILADANESWEKVENDIAERIEHGRLF